MHLEVLLCRYHYMSIIVMRDFKKQHFFKPKSAEIKVSYFLQCYINVIYITYYGTVNENLFCIMVKRI